MAISGTGTGPFTITGTTETTLTIYTYVVAQNAANATKNSDSTAFDFNCVLYVGDGTTATAWTSLEEMVRIDAAGFQIRAAATLTIGQANPAKAGSYWRWQMTAADQFLVNGTINAYASRLYASHRITSNTGAVAYFEECVIAFLDSFTNNDGVTNPNIQYVRCFVAGATAVAVKLGGTVSLSGTKISGATYAFQPLKSASAYATYTVNDYVGQGNTNDVVPNVASSATLNVVGAYDGAGVPRTGLIVAIPATGNTIRLQWKYNLNCKVGAAAAASTNIRIRNNADSTLYSGQTDASGNIPQQVLTRVEYINNATAQNRYPYTTLARRYNLSSESLTWQADNHTAEKIVHATVPYLTLTEAQAAALTGIAINPVSLNKIVNGTFDADTNWTKGTGVTISGGVANASSAGAILAQAGTAFVSGKTYQVSFSYTKTAGSALRFGQGVEDGTNIVYTSAALANGSGTITQSFVAGSSTAGFYIGASGNVYSGTIDNVSVQEVGAVITSGTLEVTGTRTVSDLWHYYRQWIATLANFDTSDTWDFDGSTLDVGAWNITNSGTITGNLKTTGTVTNTGTITGTYTDASGTRVTLKDASGIPLSTRVVVNGTTDLGVVVNTTERYLFVQPTDVVRIYATGYGYKQRLYEITGATASDYVISLIADPHVDTGLSTTIRDQIAAHFAFGVDGSSNVFMSTDADLRAYSPAEVANAFSYYVFLNPTILAIALMTYGTPGGDLPVDLGDGSLIVKSPLFYGKVADSVTTVNDLGIYIPFFIDVDPAVYVALPSYTPVRKNTSGILLSSALWTKQSADISTADKADIRNGLALQASLQIVNNGVKNASLLIPHSENL